MNNLRCFLIDDEFASIDVLRKFVSKTPGLTLVGWSEHPLEALDILAASPPDVLFLDVHMPALSGLDLKPLLPAGISVIFCTAFPRHAVKAFDLDASDFLLKPFGYERFLQAVNRVKQSRLISPVSPVSPQPSFFYIKSDTRGKLVRLVYDDIIFIKAAQNYVEIHCSKGRYLTHLTMWEMEEALSGRAFARIHKSGIINLNQVRSIENGVVVLVDGTLMTIGENYREDFFAQLSSWSVFSRRHGL